MSIVMNVTRGCDGKWHPNAHYVTLRYLPTFNETIIEGGGKGDVLKHPIRKICSIAAMEK